MERQMIDEKKMKEMAKRVCLPMCGLPLGENFRLDKLADDCAKDGIYEFMFVSPPLLVTNGTASPLNPYVIK